MLVFGAIGWTSSVYLRKIILPFNIEIAFNMAVCMQAGLMVRVKLRDLLEYVNMDRRCFLKTSLLGCVLTSIRILLALCNREINVRANDYPNYLLYVFTAAVLIAAVICWASVLQNLRLLQYIGRHTLIVLMFHKFVILFFTVLFSYTKNVFKAPYSFKTYICMLLTVAFSFAVCLLLGRILRLIIKQI